MEDTEVSSNEPTQTLPTASPESTSDGKLRVLSSVSVRTVHTAHLGTVSQVTFSHTQPRTELCLRRRLEARWRYRHPNVATVFRVECQPGRTSLLVECPEYDTFSHYSSHHDVSWGELLDITRDVLRALVFLEVSGQGMSRDTGVNVQLSNIWVFTGGVAKVACCGLPFGDGLELSPDEELPPSHSHRLDDDQLGRPESSAISSFGGTLLSMIESVPGEETFTSPASIDSDLCVRLANIPPSCPDVLTRLLEMCFPGDYQHQRTFREMYSEFQCHCPLTQFSTWDVSLHNKTVPKDQRWVIYKKQVFEFKPQASPLIDPSSANFPGTHTDLNKTETPDSIECHGGYGAAITEETTPYGESVGICPGVMCQDTSSTYYAPQAACDRNTLLCDKVVDQHCQDIPTHISKSENMFSDECSGYQHDQSEGFSNDSYNGTPRNIGDGVVLSTCHLENTSDQCDQCDHPVNHAPATPSESDTRSMCNVEGGRPTPNKGTDVYHEGRDNSLSLSPEVCDTCSGGEDSGEEACSESWQEVTGSQCEGNTSSNGENDSLCSYDFDDGDGIICYTENGTLSDISTEEQCSDYEDNVLCTEEIFFSDGDGLNSQGVLNNNTGRKTDCAKRESFQRKDVVGSVPISDGEASINYDDIGFFSDDAETFQTSDRHTGNRDNDIKDGLCPNSNVNGTSSNTEDGICKDYVPSEEISLYIDDDVSELSVDQRAFVTDDDTDKGDNSPFSNDTLTSSDDDCHCPHGDCQSDENLIPYEEIGFFSDDDLRNDQNKQSENGRGSFHVEQTNSIGCDASFDIENDNSVMSNEDMSPRIEVGINFQKVVDVCDEFVPNDEIGFFSDDDFYMNGECENRESFSELNESDANVQEGQLLGNCNPNDEIGFLSDEDICFQNGEWHNGGTVSSVDEDFLDGDQSENEICYCVNNENTYGIEHWGDDILYQEKFRGDGDIGLTAVVSTTRCDSLVNVLDVPHRAVETVSLTDLSTSSECNIVNIKGVKQTVGRRLGTLSGLSPCDTWSDARQDIVILLQDLDMTQDDKPMTPVMEDFKRCLLWKIREIDEGHFEDPNVSTVEDLNSRPFPVPCYVRANPSSLRSWLGDWVPFDTTLPESGCAWTQMDYSGQLSETNDEPKPPWYGEWQPFDMSIDGETAWRNLPLDVIANDLPTKQQMRVMGLRQQHKHCHTEAMASKRRQVLGLYFREKYGFASDAIDGYLGFANRLKENDEELQCLVDMDFSFVIV